MHKYLFLFIFFLCGSALAEAPKSHPAWKAATSKAAFQSGETAVLVLENLAYEKLVLYPRLWLEHFAGGKWLKADKLGDAKKIKLKPQSTKSFSWPLEKLKPGIYRFIIFNREDFNEPPIITNSFEVK